MDIVHSLESYWRENIIYPAAGGLGRSSATESVTGFVNGVPYGDLYRVNDVFLTEGDSQLAGKVMYVAKSEPGSPDMLLEEFKSPGMVRPVITHLDQSNWPEARSDRVMVGLKIRPSSRFQPIIAGFGHREWHADMQDVILRQPFWRGGVFVHVDAGNSWDEKYVSDLLNQGFDYTTRIYKFSVKFRPTRFDVRNMELQGRWRSVINCNLTAEVTPDTPIHDLPLGMPVVSYPQTPITGMTPVVELPDKRYAESAGDYQVHGGPHHNPLPLWPEEEP